MSPSVFSNIAVALLVLGVIIVIHELGHFLVAKLFKIKVETFSVGFGPRLFGFRRGETDYRISALPLGGYVKMAGETPTDAITGAPNEFMSKPKWQRFLVAAAGPLMNLVLAVGLMAGLYVYGTQVPEFMSGQEGPMRMFEKLGFVRIAVLPEHVLDRRGQMHDLIVMTYDLHSEETSPVD